MGNKVGGGTGRRAALNKSVDAPKTSGTTARQSSVTKSVDTAKKPTTSFDSAKGTTARREEINKRLTGDRPAVPAGTTSRRASIWKEIKED